MTRDAASSFERLIPPEISGDAFSWMLQQIAADPFVRNILEIGSSAGEGSTAALVAGIRASGAAGKRLFCVEISKTRHQALGQRYAGDAFVHCFNASSVPAAALPSEKEVTQFFVRVPSALNLNPLEQVLQWLRVDKSYIASAGVNENGIALIKQQANIEHFDAVLIDGSEFAGRAEMEQVYGAGVIMLDDVNSFKNRENYQRLCRDPGYRLVAQNLGLRAGFAVFRRRDFTCKFDAVLISETDLRDIIAAHGIVPRGVIHVGRDEGGELPEYLRVGAQHALMIEANPAVYDRLSANVQKFKNVAAVNCAITDFDGTVTLHVTSMDQSSSILPLKKHKEIYPTIVETGQIEVPARRIDSLLREVGRSPSQFNIMHLDIQGAELRALKGATETLRQIDVIRTEVNFEELYEGCALIGEMDQFLALHGFVRVALDQSYHPTWGDAIYVAGPVVAMSTLGRNGRFANQLFQYSFLKIYAKLYGLRVMTGSWIGRFLFGADEPLATRWLPLAAEMDHALTSQVRDGHAFDAPEPLRDVDLWGYFQFHTSNYAPHKDFVRELFTPAGKAAEVAQQAEAALRSRGKTVVGLHLRRGDYRTLGENPYVFIPPNAWYVSWLDEIWPTLDQPVLFIASDEPAEVVNDFAKFNPITVGDLALQLPEAPFYLDFHLVSRCDAVAISNSSFSFFACMLNDVATKFMRPDPEAEKLVAFDPWNTSPLLMKPASGAADAPLPVHFFTIVLNGEPFIRKHIETFTQLGFDWHWHIVEGAAELKHDTAWSVRAGGHMAEKCHRGGLSVDGTSQYLDELLKEYPDRVTVYRKAPGQLWDGKIEMVRAPLSQVKQECLLWEIDVDEIWTAEQLTRAREMFLDDPSRSAAFFRCWFFVGPDLITTTQIPEANDPTDWIRAWRFVPGMQWATHEPPSLAEFGADGNWHNVAERNPFRQDETAAAGLVFQHFAYATRKQLEFKQDYYGYRGVVEQWDAMQHAALPVRIREFFPWFKYDSTVDRAPAQLAPLIDRQTLESSSFVPPEKPKSQVTHLALLRTDSLGDNVIASCMWPRIREAYPNARITMICQGVVAPLYEVCPHVDATLSYDRGRAYNDREYLNELVQRVRELGADLTLNTAYSRELLADFLANATSSSERVAFRGDSSNLDAAQRNASNAGYTRLIDDDRRIKPELEIHGEFLNALRIEAGELQPVVWTTDDDARVADDLLRAHDLDPQSTIAMFTSAQFPIKDYDEYGAAIAQICHERGLRVVALGDGAAKDANLRNLAALGDAGVDLSGRTTIRQSAEIVRRCKLAFGADTSLAHIACAVGTPNVILCGGGLFGRFLPYSPLTTMVCLPIACYNCAWNCRYERVHCVRGAEPVVIECAVRETLERSSSKPRVFVQDRSLWPQGPRLPDWKWFHDYLQRDTIDLFAVRRGGLASQIIFPARHQSIVEPTSQHARRRTAAVQSLGTTQANFSATFDALAGPLIADNIANLPLASDEVVVLDEILSGLARGDADPFAGHYRAVARLYLTDAEFVPPT